MNIRLSVLFLAAVMASCATVEYQKETPVEPMKEVKVENPKPEYLPGYGPKDIEQILALKNMKSDNLTVVEVEKPVYVASVGAGSDKGNATGGTGNSGSSGYGKVPVGGSFVIDKGQAFADGGSRVYDFQPDWVYRIYCVANKYTAIELEPGEKVLSDPIIGDNIRWVPGTASHFAGGAGITTIYYKPMSEGIETSLFLSTDRRRYNIMLVSNGVDYFPVVKWRYPSQFHLVQTAVDKSAESGADVLDSLFDRSKIHVNEKYRLEYSWSKPYWYPEKVFDDGKKTYIILPKEVLNRQIPVVSRANGDVVNYRYSENVIAIDLIAKDFALTSEDKQIKIFNEAIKD